MPLKPRYLQLKRGFHLALNMGNKNSIQGILTTKHLSPKQDIIWLRDTSSIPELKTKRSINLLDTLKKLNSIRTIAPEKMFAPLGFDDKCIILKNLLHYISEPNVVDIKVDKTDSNAKLN
jgi:hypothetical protein